MNILFLSEPSYPRHPGGAGKSTHVLAAALANRGHTVRILCGSSEPTEVEILDDVEVHRLAWPDIEQLDSSLREAATTRFFLEYLTSYVDLSLVDIVYDSGVFLSYFFPLARELQHRYGIRFLAHYRYLLARDFVSREPPGEYNALSASGLWFGSLVHTKTQGFPARFADAIICPSKGDADFVEVYYRPACGRPAVVPEPIRAPAMDADAAQQVRNSLVGGDEQLVLFAGRIDAKGKGAGIVRLAFERVLKQQPGARLLLLVKDEGWLDPYRGLGDAVVSLPWMDDARDFAVVLEAVDVVVIPSLYESFGMLAVEALVMGTPVVASAVGGMAQVVADGQNGFLLHGRDPRAWVTQLAEQTLFVLRRPEIASHTRLQAPNVRDAHSPERIGELVEDICLEMLERPVRRGVIEPPSLTRSDRDAYLAAIGRMAGARGVSVAEATLRTWSTSSDSRCQECTRARISNDMIALRRLRKWRPPWFWATLRGQRQTKIDEAVARACPLGVLQLSRVAELAIDPLSCDTT